MELINITQAIYNTAKAIDQEKKDLEKLAKDKAIAEREYRMALAKAIFALKAQGFPATLISDLARGETAELKFTRDLADNLFVAKRSSIDASLSQLTALQSILRIQKEIAE
jgi:hypothetical protein